MKPIGNRKYFKLKGHVHKVVEGKPVKVNDYTVEMNQLYEMLIKERMWKNRNLVMSEGLENEKQI